MKDINKLKEFFLSNKAATTAYESVKENKEKTTLDTQISDLLKYKSFEEVKKIVAKALRDALIEKEKGINEASSLTKVSRKIGWAGEDWTPQEFAAQIKSLPDETLLKWAEGNKGISNTPLAFQQKLVKIELAKRGLNEAKEKDAVDTITMDIPLFIRMLEYSREDAAADVDLHDVTEKAIALSKEVNVLQMEDYDEIIGAAEDTSQEEINEELCPAGKAYIKRRKAAGEKSSAYLSGRAVKVCKGLMSGKKKKK